MDGNGSGKLVGIHSLLKDKGPVDRRAGTARVKQCSDLKLLKVISDDSGRQFK